MEGRIDLSVPGYIFPFEKLEVWQESLALANYVVELLERIPLSTHVRLTSKLEGAVVSASGGSFQNPSQVLFCAEPNTRSQVEWSDEFHKRKEPIESLTSSTFRRLQTSNLRR